MSVCAAKRQKSLQSMLKLANSEGVSKFLSFLFFKPAQQSKSFNEVERDMFLPQSQKISLTWVKVKKL